MKNSVRFITTTVIFYSFILILINGIYFIGLYDSYPKCGLISIIFCNLAVIWIILTDCFDNKTDEKNQRGGLKLLSSIYLIIEIGLAFYFLSHDSDRNTAGIVQGLVFALFVVCFLGFSRATAYTNDAIREVKQNRSDTLRQARCALQLALADNHDKQQREILRESLTELSAFPPVSNEQLDTIDSEIFSLVLKLCELPSIELRDSLYRIVKRRQTMQKLLLQ